MVKTSSIGEGLSLERLLLQQRNVKIERVEKSKVSFEDVVRRGEVFLMRG
jgi:hypothetical protein